MIEETFEDLAQRELDGATTPEESARLHRWLESNDTARAHYAELQRVFDTLKLVRPVEPPAHGITATLQAVRAAEPPPKPRRATVTNLSEFRMYMGLKSALLHRRYAMSKKVLMSVAAVAVAVIGYFAISGFPPTPKGTDATIQGAKRHQVEQMKSEDVVLQDPEVQAFLQTDYFNALITDKNFQRLTADRVVQQLMVTGVDKFALLSVALENPEFRAALASKNTVSAMLTLEKIQVLHSDVARASLGATLNSAFERTEFADALANKDVAAAKTVLLKVYSDHSSVEHAAVAKMATAAFQRQDFVNALANKDVAAAMAVLDKTSVGMNDVQRYYLMGSVANVLERTGERPTVDKKGNTVTQATFDKEIVGRFELERIGMERVITHALANSDVREALANKDVVTAMMVVGKTEVARLSADRAALNSTLSSAELQKYFNANDIAALSTLASYEFRYSLANAAFAKVVTNKAFLHAMETGDARAFVGN